MTWEEGTRHALWCDWWNLPPQPCTCQHTEGWRGKVRAIMDLQDLAYGGPWGTWAQRWIPFVCKHLRVRCTHGDEIIARGFRRRACLDCGRSLRGPLPDKCFFSPTAKSHGV